MDRKIILAMTLTLLLASILMLAFNIQPVKSMQEPPSVQWSKIFGEGYSEGTFVIQTRDGGYLVEGDRGENVPPQGIWLIKTDSSGDVQWNRTYAGPEGTSHPCVVLETLDGDCLIGGSTERLLPEEFRPEVWQWDFWLVRVDAYGNVRWSKTFGGYYEDMCNFVIQTSDGGFAMIGNSYSFGGPTYMSRMWLVKTDSYGNHEWNMTYGVEGNVNYAYSVIQTGDGGFTIAGGTVPWKSGGWCPLLVKTDLYGNMQWNKTCFGQGGIATSLIQTFDGAYAYVYSLTGSGGLVKTDAYGNPQWSKNIGESESLSSLVQDLDGGYVFGGSAAPSGAWEDFLVVKLDFLGNLQWDKSLGGSGRDECRSIQQTDDKGYILVGTIDYEFGPTRKIWLVKLGPWTPTPPPSLSVSISPLSASILLGQSEAFASTVSGGYPPYSYQWYLDGVPVSEATSNAWTFAPTTTGSHIVYLNVTDNMGKTARSNEASVAVAPQFTASISPMSAPMLVGQTVTFTSAVSGGYIPYSYQWCLNGNPVLGATSNTWNFTAIGVGTYYVYLKVIDNKGNIAQSDNARTTVAAVAVGGYSIQIHRRIVQPKTEPIMLYIGLIVALAAIFTELRPRTKRER